MKEIENIQKWILIILGLVVLATLFLLPAVSDNYNEEKELAQKIEIEIQEQFIEQVYDILERAKNEKLASIRVWVDNNEKQSIIKRDKIGRKIYKSFKPIILSDRAISVDMVENLKKADDKEKALQEIKEMQSTGYDPAIIDGEELIFDKETMEIKWRQDGFVDILSKNGELLLEKADTIWDKNTFINIAQESGLAHFDIFGSSSDTINYDHKTGVMLHDKSGDCPMTPEVTVYNRDGTVAYRAVYFDENHRNNSYPKASEWLIDNKWMWGRDERLIYTFTMNPENVPLGEIKNNEIMTNFKKHPLGSRNREWQLKYRTPTADLGFRKTNKEFTTMVVMQEPEGVNRWYDETIKDWKELKQKRKVNYILSYWLPKLIVGLCLLAIFLAWFVVKKANILCNKEG